MDREGYSGDDFDKSFRDISDEQEYEIQKISEFCSTIEDVHDLIDIHYSDASELTLTLFEEGSSLYIDSAADILKTIERVENLQGWLADIKQELEGRL